jgi:hypothetical protein
MISPAPAAGVALPSVLVPHPTVFVFDGETGGLVASWGGTGSSCHTGLPSTTTTTSG